MTEHKEMTGRQAFNSCMGAFSRVGYIFMVAYYVANPSEVPWYTWLSLVIIGLLLFVE